MRAADAVIFRPANVRPLRRAFLGGLTLLAWVGFFWLLTPALPSGLRAVGLGEVYDTVGRVGPIDPVIAMAVFVVSVLAAGALLLWAELQRRRFTGVERRHRAPDATLEEMASTLGADAATSRTLRSSRIVSLRMREDGSPETASVVRIPRPRRPVDRTRTATASSQRAHG